MLVDVPGLLRASVRHFLASDPRLEVIGDCDTPGEALDFLRTATDSGSPDVVLFDLNIGAKEAREFIHMACQSGYKGRFLILVADAEAKDSAVVLSTGASGIFSKSGLPQRLIDAIIQIAAGETWIERRTIQLLAEQVVNQTTHIPGRGTDKLLTDREQQVLAGIVNGWSNRKIGSSLGISESFTKNIIQHLFARTGVRTRSQLVRLALEGSLGATTVPARIGGAREL